MPKTETIKILTELGLIQSGKATDGTVAFVPPSWRRDLTREVDLIEEVARIHGYDQIPADVPVPLRPSTKTHRDCVTGAVCDMLTASGFFEAVTMSFVSGNLCDLFTPRGRLPKLAVEHSSRRHENVLRQSLVPSLLVSRRENERHGTFNADLFEIAKVYLKAAPGEPENTVEPTMISLVSGRSFSETKGILETLAGQFNRAAAVTVRASGVPQFVCGRGAEILLNDRLWGWLGELERSVSDQLDLRDAVTVAEVELSVLEAVADLTPTFTPLPQFPTVERDLNFVLDDAVTWQKLENVVHSAAGPLLDSVSFGGQYRGKQIVVDKKSYVVRISYRAPDRTLTAEDVDRAQADVIAACEQQLGATLR